MTAAEVMQRLDPLAGTWKGQGKAYFPTIKDFVYDEEVRFVKASDRPALYYEQRAAFKQPGAAAVAGVHWETGFIRVLDDGGIELVNAQGNGRLEHIRLTIREVAGGIELTGDAKQFNDARMKGATRVYTLTGDVLRYTLHMATTNVGASTRHLDAELRRV